MKKILQLVFSNNCIFDTSGHFSENAGHNFKNFSKPLQRQSEKRKSGAAIRDEPHLQQHKKTLEEGFVKLSAQISIVIYVLVTFKYCMRQVIYLLPTAFLFSLCASRRHVLPED